MKTKSILLAMLLLIASAVLTACGGKSGQTPSQGGFVEPVEVVSSKDFATTDQQLTAALRAANLLVLGEFDYQKMQRMVGREVRPAKGYNFFRPDLGIPIFQSDPTASLEIPLKIVVVEKPDGKVVVRYRKPSAILGGYKGLSELGGRLDQLVDQLVTAATK